MVQKKSAAKTGTQEETLRELKLLNTRIEKLTNRKEVLKMGLWRGIGFFIGVTIIGGLILSIVLAIFQLADNVPILRDIIESTNVQESVKQELSR